MERIPSWLFLVGVVLFGALAIWSATDQNWAGLIAGLVLAAACVVGLVRRPRPG
jgi:membrane protein YdbS with pleckstrin-like domain